jgi:FkbM family methyltransferase
MLMSLESLVDQYGLTVSGVLHVGAHLAEEAAEYERLHMHDVWWVEANPRVLPLIEENLKYYPQQQLIQGLVYSQSGVELPFNVTNYDGMSSSIFEFGTHPTFSPDTIFVERITLPTTTIDEIVKANNVRANFLNMDLQGAELHALQGATDFLLDVDYIMTEVNKTEVYVGCAQVGQLDDYLEAFSRVETYWVGDQGWGDALYLRKF